MSITSHMEEYGFVVETMKMLCWGAQSWKTYEKKSNGEVTTLKNERGNKGNKKNTQRERESGASGSTDLRAIS